MERSIVVAGGRGANYRLATLLLSICLLKCVVADILVYQQDQLLEEFRDFPATFGSDIPESGLKVRAVRANPIDGCTELDPPPENVTTVRFAVIIARYNCSFEDKVRYAQKAGYSAVIVHNVGSNDLERMSANHAEDILIPSVFIGESNGIYIIDSFLYPQAYTLIITDDIPFNINNNLIIPFAIVVGLCFIIMICFMIIRCIRERRRMLRHRLPNSVLKKIPIVKFAKGMQYETCAICLDDYVDNERLRVLPCHHAYHVKCIDPWLTKNRRVCPICKRKVFARGERRPPRRRSSTDSMSSSDADEHTPLLNSGSDNNPVTTDPPSQENAGTTAASPGGRRGGGGGGSNEAHVVNMASDDDELLDDTNVHEASGTSREGGRQWSFNPFDRLIQSQAGAASGQQVGDVEEGGNAESPYSPIGEEHSSASTWNRFLSKMRIFRMASSQADQELPSDDDVEPATGEPGRNVARDPTGRIAINSGLAPAGTASNNILNSNLAGSFHGDDTTDDEMVGASRRDEAKRRQIRSAPNLPSTSGTSSGSGGGAGRVGVAALPNVNFNPNPGGSGRRSNRSGGGNYPV